MAVKSERLQLRIAPSERAIVARAAEALDVSVSEFMLESAHERAERVLADRSTFVLADDQWSAFSRALDRQPQAIPELVELLRRPRPE